MTFQMKGLSDSDYNSGNIDSFEFYKYDNIINRLSFLTKRLMSYNFSKN